jgi:hypothetical protein
MTAYNYFDDYQYTHSTEYNMIIQWCHIIHCDIELQQNAL